ncbi:hypothetical protein HZS_233, partial [Henneguya salminicola]
MTDLISWVPKNIDFSIEEYEREFKKYIKKFLINIQNIGQEKQNEENQHESSSVALHCIGNDLWEAIQNEIENDLSSILQKSEERNKSAENVLEYISFLIKITSEPDININAPKLYNKMLLHIHLNNYFSEPTRIVPYMANQILEKKIEDIKKEVYEKWALELRRDNHTVLCHNWHLKIYSNPDLVSRLFTAIYFMPIKNYIDGMESNDLLNIVYQIRGVANILCSSHLYMLLVHVSPAILFKMVSRTVPSLVKQISRACLDDISQAFIMPDWYIPITNVDPSLSSNCLFLSITEPSECCSLIAPCLKYIMYYALQGCKKASAVNELAKSLIRTNTAPDLEIFKKLWSLAKQNTDTQ